MNKLPAYVCCTQYILLAVFPVNIHVLIPYILYFNSNIIACTLSYVHIRLDIATAHGFVNVCTLFTHIYSACDKKCNLGSHIHYYIHIS